MAAGGHPFPLPEQVLNSWISRNCVLWPAALLKGEHITRYLSAYRRSQWWSASELAALQASALSRLLRHAAAKSVFHSRRWTLTTDLLAPDLTQTLSRLPFMNKADLAERFSDVVTGSSYWATRKTTGGSTGQAVTLLKNPGALARERAATYRSYEWAGVEVGAPQARFWGVPHTRSRRFYYSMVDFVANRQRLSAFNFSETNLNSYYEQLVKFRPKYLYGYASMLKEFAAFVSATSKQLPASVVSVITTSEILTAGLREELQHAFQVPVFNEYGCGEVGSIGHECERGGLHLMAENLIVEIVDADGKPAAAGEIVVTDLHNYATPLIRYRLGDFAVASAAQCACGRGLPLISGVHGRAYDFVRAPDGKLFHPEALIYVFEMLKGEGAPIQQFQIEQTSGDTLAVRVVPKTGFGPSISGRIEELLHKHVSPLFRIDITTVDEIRREASGKLRLVKSRLAAQVAEKPGDASLAAGS